MSKDIKIFNACDHIVNNIKYKDLQCPRCYGKGYYYDIAFDTNGKTIMCENDIKLQQEVLKIMNDKKGGNKFHIQWGDPLVTDKVIGKKNIEVTMQKIKMAIYETLRYLQSIQTNNETIFKNMSDQEIINSILSINVIQSGPMSYNISVIFSNETGTIFKQQIII